jgi:hypothetical protein
MWKTAKYTWMDHNTNEGILNEVEVTSILYKIWSYKIEWIQHVSRIARCRVPNLSKKYVPRGIRNKGRPLKRLLDEWDWNRPAVAYFPESEMMMMMIDTYQKLKLSHYTPRRRLGLVGDIAPTLSRPRYQMRESGQCQAPAALYPRGKDPGTHCTGGWMGLRAGLDTKAKWKILLPLPGIDLDRPVVQPVARRYTDWATRLTIAICRVH